MTSGFRHTAKDELSMMEGLQACIDNRQISYALLDDLIGWSSGYAGHAFGPARKKRLGMFALWLAIQGLGLRMVLEDDPDQLGKMERRYEKRVGNKRVMNNTSAPLGKKAFERIAKEMGRKGGRLGMRKRFRITPQAVVEQRRNAAIARWEMHRKRVKEGLEAQRAAQQSPQPGA